MFAIVGILVVLGCVVGGYLMGHGNLSVLFQPAEVIIIFGAALGSLLIATPLKTVKQIIGDLIKVFTSKGVGKEHFTELLLLMNQLFMKARKEGLLAIEADVENAAKSPIFSKFPGIMHDPGLVDFICDNFRVIITTNMPPYELESLMDVDIESTEHEKLAPSASVNKTADALPGLGIVAAVLGVVITMGKISEPPEVLGHHIGAALVGTFMGVLMCYGFVGPIATSMENQVKEHAIYHGVVKAALVAFVGGAAPQIAVESGRRAIPNGERPTFKELEEAIKKWKARA